MAKRDTRTVDRPIGVKRASLVALGVAGIAQSEIWSSVAALQPREGEPADPPKATGRDPQRPRADAAHRPKRAA